MYVNSARQMEFPLEILNGPQLVCLEGVFIGKNNDEEISSSDGVFLGSSAWTPDR